MGGLASFWKSLVLVAVITLASCLAAFKVATEYDMGFPVNGGSILLLLLGWLASTVVLGMHQTIASGRRTAADRVGSLVAGGLLAFVMLMATAAMCWAISVRE